MTQATSHAAHFSSFGSNSVFLKHNGYISMSHTFRLGFQLNYDLGG